MCRCGAENDASNIDCSFCKTPLSRDPRTVIPFAPQPMKSKRVQNWVAAILILIGVGLVIRAMLLDQQHQREITRQAALAQQTQQAQQERNRQIREKSELRAKRIRRFISTITHRGGPDQDRRARFLNSSVPCSAITRFLDQPDERKSNRDEFGFVHINWIYRLADNRTAEFECLRVTTANASTVSDVSFEGEDISGMFWSLQR